MSDGVSVVTTTWNEKENIRELIARIRANLANIPHEVIVVDDSSEDGTLEVAKQYADIAVSKIREGQTKGLVHGMKLVKYPALITIDSDLENSPELIPTLISKLNDFDIVVASRTKLPRFSEKFAAKTLGKICGCSDFYSNFRAFKKTAINNLQLRGGETFGGEILVFAKKHGCKIGEVLYHPLPRRIKPRIGGTIKANARISFATFKCLIIYLL